MKDKLFCGHRDPQRKRAFGKESSDNSNYLSYRVYGVEKELIMNEKQRDDICYAFDILVHVMHDIEDTGKHIRIVRKLDVIVGLIESLLVEAK